MYNQNNIWNKYFACNSIHLDRNFIQIMKSIRFGKLSSACSINVWFWYECSEAFFWLYRTRKVYILNQFLQLAIEDLCSRKSNKKWDTNNYLFLDTFYPTNNYYTCVSSMYRLTVTYIDIWVCCAILPFLKTILKCIIVSSYFMRH